MLCLIAASSVTATILVLKSLILSPASTPAGAASLVARLASRLTTIHNSEARACVIWLVGEHPGEGGRMGMEVLRLGTKDFAYEVRLTARHRLSSGLFADLIVL